MLGEKEIFRATLITFVETLKISSESHMTTGVKKKLKKQIHGNNNKDLGNLFSCGQESVAHRVTNRTSALLFHLLRPI